MSVPLYFNITYPRSSAPEKKSHKDFGLLIVFDGGDKILHTKKPEVRVLVLVRKWDKKRDYASFQIANGGKKARFVRRG